MKCIGPKAKHVDLWMLIWEEVPQYSSRRNFHRKSEHVKAHRSKKEQKNMTLFESFVTDGTERAAELAKDGVMLDVREMDQIRASTVQRRREEWHAALQYAAGLGCVVEEWHDSEELDPRRRRNVDLRGERKWKLRNIARSGVRPRANIVA